MIYNPRTREQLLHDNAELESRIAALTAELELNKQALANELGAVARLRDELTATAEEARGLRLRLLNRESRVAQLEWQMTNRSDQQAFSEAVAACESAESDREALLADVEKCHFERGQLLAEVARLREELALQKDMTAEALRAQNVTADSLATERAAREKAEECATELRGQYAEKSEALILAERERDAALARVAEVTEQRDMWAKQCNMASEAQADAASKLSTALAALKAGTSREVVAHAETLVKLRAMELDREEFTQRDAAERMRLVKLVQELEAKNERLSAAIDQAIRDMLSGGHPFEKGVAKAINDLRAAQKDPERSDKHSRWNDLGELPVTVMATSEYPSPAPCSGCAAARELLASIVTYAREDRAETPGVTRLARALVRAEAWLKEHP